MSVCVCGGRFHLKFITGSAIVCILSLTATRQERFFGVSVLVQAEAAHQNDGQEVWLTTGDRDRAVPFRGAMG